MKRKYIIPRHGADFSVPSIPISCILETKNCARKNVVMNRNRDNLLRNEKYYQEWRGTGEWEEIPKILSIDVYRPLYSSCVFHICMWWAFLVSAVFFRGNPGGKGLPIILCKLTRVYSVCSVWGPDGEGFPSWLTSYVHFFVSVSNSHCLVSTHRKTLFSLYCSYIGNKYFTEIFNYARSSVIFFLFVPESFSLKGKCLWSQFLRNEKLFSKYHMQNTYSIYKKNACCLGH